MILEIFVLITILRYILFNFLVQNINPLIISFKDIILFVLSLGTTSLTIFLGFLKVKEIFKKIEIKEVVGKFIYLNSPNNGDSPKIIFEVKFYIRNPKNEPITIEVLPFRYNTKKITWTELKREIITEIKDNDEISRKNKIRLAAFHIEEFELKGFIPNVELKKNIADIEIELNFKTAKEDIIKINMNFEKKEN